MKNIKPYLVTAAVVLVVIAVFKAFITPMAPASLQKYLPA